MTDFAAARRMMVDGQVRPSDVTDLRVIAAMLELPRERFVPVASLAYLDTDLAIGASGAGGERHMLKPMVLAKLLDAADVTATDRVLDVGSLTGYSSALIAKLAHHVIALDDDVAFTQQATQNFRALGLANVAAVTGPLRDGWPAEGPYDVIVFNGATEIEPKALFRQLRDGGRFVGVFGRGRSAKAKLYRCAHGDVSGLPIFDAAAPVLSDFVQPPAFAF